MIEHPDVVVTFAVLLFVPSARQALTRLGKHAVHNIAPLVRKSKQGKQLAEACAGNGAVLTPIKTVVHNGAETVVKTYATLCEEVYATCKKVPLFKKGKRHVFMGELHPYSQQPVGLHSEVYRKGLLVPGKQLPPDKFGVYGGFYKENGWLKYSTFFPKNFPEEAVCAFVDDAFSNPVSKGADFVIGKTKLGMEIKIVFEKINGVLQVKTTFPAYNGEFNGMKLVNLLGEKCIKRKA